MLALAFGCVGETRGDGYGADDKVDEDEEIGGCEPSCHESIN